MPSKFNLSKVENFTCTHVTQPPSNGYGSRQIRQYDVRQWAPGRAARAPNTPNHMHTRHTRHAWKPLQQMAAIVGGGAMEAEGGGGERGGGGTQDTHGSPVRQAYMYPQCHHSDLCHSIQPLVPVSQAPAQSTVPQSFAL